MWPAVLVASLGAFATKWAGHLLPESLLERDLVRRAAAVLPIALLAALLAIQTFWLARRRRGPKRQTCTRRSTGNKDFWRWEQTLSQAIITTPG